MDVEVVANQMNLAGVGEVMLEQLSDLVGPVDTRAMFRSADATPSQQRREEHEHGPRSMTLIFVVLTNRLARRHGQRLLEMVV